MERRRGKLSQKRRKTGGVGEEEYKGTEKGGPVRNFFLH